MRLWPSGISLYCTDTKNWVPRAWGILNTHWRRKGTFFEEELRIKFWSHGLEWKGQAVKYLCADIRRESS